MSNQNELNLGKIDIDAVLAQPGLDCEPLDARWPDNLAAAVDVLFTDNLRRGMDEATAIAEARRAVLVLANYQGGRSIYWPRGDDLTIALRDREIYLLWNGGRNKESLAERFGLTVRSVERIYAEQYRLGIKRRQGNLFANKEG
jgi:Mor family transcriptional regulator